MSIVVDAHREGEELKIGCLRTRERVLYREFGTVGEADHAVSSSWRRMHGE